MSQEFVWKPTSEADGNLVVLFPAGTSAPQNVFIVLSNGQVVQGNLQGLTNGNRPTYRFPDNGANYGGNIALVGPDGQAFGIKSGAQRYDGGNPPQQINNEQEFTSFNQTGSTSGGGGGGTQQPSNQQFQQTGGARGEQQARTSEGRRGRGRSTTRRRGEDDGGGRFSGGRGDGGPTPEDVLAGNVPGGPGQGTGGFAAPQADFSSLEFQSVSPTLVAPPPTVDPIERTGEVGDFNRLQTAVNTGIAAQRALELTQLEFEGLQSFNRQARELQQEGIISENLFNQQQVALANAFNRGEIPDANLFNQEQIELANEFNQQQRTQQLETALPGARETIQRQIERGAELAEGGFAVDAEDRAFEVASRSAAADATLARGFGDESVFGRRTSELLSAEQRLQVSQVGEQTLGRFLTLGANLAFDQPIKQNPILDQPLQFQPQQARTSQDVRGAPSIPTSQLALSEQQRLDQLTTIAPQQAIAFDINQNQFATNVDKFNSSLDFEAQKFNSSGQLQVDLEKLYADVFNSQQSASAFNLGVQQDRADQRFAEGQSAGQQASALQTGGQVFASLVDRYGEDAVNAVFGDGDSRATGTADDGRLSTQEDQDLTLDTELDTTQQTQTTGDFTFEEDTGGDFQLDTTFQTDTGGETTSFDFGTTEEDDFQRTARQAPRGQQRQARTAPAQEEAAPTQEGTAPAVTQEVTEEDTGGFEAVGSGRTTDARTTGAGLESLVEGDVLPKTQTEQNIQAAGQFGVNLATLAIGWNDMSDEQRAVATAQLFDTVAGTGTADYIQFAINVANYAEEFDEMNQSERAAAESQIYATTVDDPYASTIAQVATIGSNWDDMSDAERHAAVSLTAADYVIAAWTGVPGVASTFDKFMDSVFGINLAGMYEDVYGTNKSKDQQFRDAMRDHAAGLNLVTVADEDFAQANGVEEGSYQIQLADGTYYDIGVDGGAKLDNYALNIDGKDQRNTFDVDWSDPRAQETVGMLNPLAFMLYGEHAPKFMGHLFNAATSNNNTISGTKENVKHFVESTGITYENGLSILKNLLDSQRIDSDSYYSFINSWNGLMLSDGVENEVVV